MNKFDCEDLFIIQNFFNLRTLKSYVYVNKHIICDLQTTYCIWTKFSGLTANWLPFAIGTDEILWLLSPVKIIKLRTIIYNSMHCYDIYIVIMTLFWFTGHSYTNGVYVCILYPLKPNKIEV